VQLKDGRTNYRKSSELFESPVYMEEVSDILCIALAGMLRQLGLERRKKNPSVIPKLHF
jgi:hypothetical protein